MTTIRITGDKALARALARAARNMSQLESPTRAASRAVARLAARYAPKRTGRLAASNHERVAGGTAVITNGVRYAAFQEYGTRVMAAHPYLRPALYAAPIEQFYEEHAREAVRRL